MGANRKLRAVKRDARLAAIDFYCFSGTGNTLLAARKMREVFEANGVSVNMYRIEDADPGKIDLNHAIGLGFPVAAFGTFLFVWDFIKSLPPASGTPVFMVDTLAPFSGGVVGPARRILKRKGYRPIGAKEIIMPNNFFPRWAVAGWNEEKIGRGLQKAEKYAEDILSGRSRWQRVPVLSDLAALISQSKRAWASIRRVWRLNLNVSRCTRCGLCARLCPVRNIEMKGYPELGDRCALCMRCISFCPVRAIYRGNDDCQLHRAVSAEEIMGGR